MAISFFTRQNQMLNYNFSTDNIFSGIIVLIVLLSCIIITILIIKTLWNSVMPRVFGAGEIDFLDTIILLFLSNAFLRN